MAGGIEMDEEFKVLEKSEVEREREGEKVQWRRKRSIIC